MNYESSKYITTDDKNLQITINNFTFTTTINEIYTKQMSFVITHPEL